MRQNKFPWAVLVTLEEGLATQCETVLRGFGLRKLIVIQDHNELESLAKQNTFDLVLVDTENSDNLEQTPLEEMRKLIHQDKQPIFVALSRIESRDELISARRKGFDSVLIKPISIGMMEQAFLEIIERQRSEPIGRDDLKHLYESFMRGNTFETQRTLNIWLEKDADSIEGLTLLSLFHLKKQEFYRAYQTVQKVLKINPGYLPALQLKTRISLRLGKIDEAFQSLTREERVVAFMDAKRAESLVHSLTKNQVKELSFCNDFATREGITTLLINLGLQLSKTGKSDDALKLYQKALGPLEDENSRFIVYFNRGRLYLKARRNPEAREDFLHAKNLAPKELQSRIDELLILSRLNTQPSALSELKKPSHKNFDGLVADHLDQNQAPVPKKQYKPFKQEEVLKLVFLGKMEESTIPPDNFHEWLQMKKKLLHILFLSDLPLTNTSSLQTNSTAELGE